MQPKLPDSFSPSPAEPEFAPAPPDAALNELLDSHAPFGPVPLVPEVSAFQGRGVVAVWEAAEQLAGRNLPAPFWAYPWAGGVALARALLDRPERVAGKRVLDVGAGGGVASFAAARAGAAEVVANDVDPWAIATLRLAAERQGLAVTPLLADLTQHPERAEAFDVVLCGDLAYERRRAGPQRALLARARAAGALVLVANAERAYFDATGMEEILELEVAVPKDLEGVERRVARVYVWR
jgi:predicted nicotinamide N-methyase